MIVRGVVLVILTVGIAGSSRGLARGWRGLVPLELLLGPWAWVLVAAAAAAIPLALAAGIRTLRRSSERPVGLAPLRAALVFGVLTAAALLTLAQPIQSLWLDLSLGPATAAYGITVLAIGRRETPSPRVRALDFAVFNLCLAVFQAEIALRIYARVAPSPLTARPGIEAASYLNVFSPSPGSLRMGFPTNSHGCYDDEFAPAPPGMRVVAALGDSFSQGVVPHPFHYTTVAERALESARVDNYGFAMIGPPEYERILRSTICPTGPDLVVVSLFVGNDLKAARASYAGRPRRQLHAWLDLDNVLVYQVPRRLAAGVEAVDQASGPGQSRRLTRMEEYTARFPWVLDPALERPTYGARDFERIETERAIDVCGGRFKDYPELFDSLRRMRELCGDVPFAIMLIPDELQVEDALWERVLELVPEGVALERDLPQRRIVAFLEQDGIPHLDLLPILRAVEPLEDGRLHVYHLRDTHFNARGNRVVGEALAELAADLLAREGGD